MWNWGNLQLLVGNWSWFRFGCRTDITVYVIGIQVSEVCRDISTLIGFMVRVMHHYLPFQVKQWANLHNYPAIRTRIVK